MKIYEGPYATEVSDGKREVVHRIYDNVFCTKAPSKFSCGGCICEGCDFCNKADNELTNEDYWKAIHFLVGQTGKYTWLL